MWPSYAGKPGKRSIVMHWRKRELSALSCHTNTLEKGYPCSWRPFRPTQIPWPTESHQASILWLISQPTHLNEEEEASCISQGLQRNRTSGICIYRKIYFKELLHVITKAGKSKICRVGWQAGGSGSSQCCVSSQKSVCWQNFFFF